VDRDRRCRIDGLEVTWDERVLRPRMWTRAQAHWAVELNPMLPDGPFLELCCGVGHIGLLAARDTGRQALLVDADAAACEHARRAVRGADLEQRVRVLRHHIDGAPVPGCAPRSAALVLIDPPYLSTGQLQEAAGDPRHAVDGGHDGLRWVEPMLRTASHHLVEGGVCLLQVRGSRQADHIVRGRRDLLAELGLRRWALRTVDEQRAVLLMCDEAAAERGIVGGVRG
jgi:methylase of polypeptide subunit release factors